MQLKDSINNLIQTNHISLNSITMSHNRKIQPYNIHSHIIIRRLLWVQDRSTNSSCHHSNLVRIWKKKNQTKWMWLTLSWWTNSLNKILLCSMKRMSKPYLEVLTTSWKRSQTQSIQQPENRLLKSLNKFPQTWPQTANQRLSAWNPRKTQTRKALEQTAIVRIFVTQPHRTENLGSPPVASRAKLNIKFFITQMKTANLELENLKPPTRRITNQIPTVIWQRWKKVKLERFGVLRNEIIIYNNYIIKLS